MMAQIINSGDGKMWLDSGNILKIEPTGFIDELDVGCEREKRKIRMTSRFWV